MSDCNTWSVWREFKTKLLLKSTGRTRNPVAAETQVQTSPSGTIPPFLFLTIIIAACLGPLQPAPFSNCFCKCFSRSVSQHFRKHWRFWVNRFSNGQTMSEIMTIAHAYTQARKTSRLKIRRSLSSHESIGGPYRSVERSWESLNRIGSSWPECACMVWPPIFMYQYWSETHACFLCRISQTGVWSLRWLESYCY